MEKAWYNNKKHLTTVTNSSVHEITLFEHQKFSWTL